MYKAIKDYCENTNNAGLLLLDMPTGFGKTYQTLNVIYEQAMEHPDKKIFFMTTLKKNLPSKELEKIFKEKGKSEIFEKRFLQLEPNSMFITPNKLLELIDDIPEDIKSTENFKVLLSNLKFLELAKDKDLSVAKQIENKIQRELEPAFRHAITKKLKQQYTTKHKRIEALKKLKELKWVAELYPSVFTSEKQIFFLSMDKFLYQHSTLVEPSFNFINHEITNNALIFIDEIDATKDVILKKIIGDYENKIIDVIRLFTSLHNDLHTKQFPRKMTINPNGSENSYLINSLDNLKSISDDIYNKYSLKYNYKVHTKDDISQNFLFRDHLTHTLTNKHIAIDTNEAERVNYVKLSDFTEVDSAQNLASMIGNMKGFLNKFSIIVDTLANNYMSVRTKGQDEFTKDEAICTILSQFTLTDQQRKHLLVSTANNISSQKNKYDLSFYENGFEYYAFKDHAEHDMHSIISMYQYHDTPEKILLAICKKAKVVGISATATLQGVIGNFDISYLKNSLGANFHTLDLESQKRIGEQFNIAMAGYKDIEIKAHFLNEELQGKYGVDSIKQFLMDSELVNAVYDKLEQKCEAVYFKERYLRIFMAYHAFVNTEEIRSFLCLLTKFPTSDDDKLDYKLLTEVFKYIEYEFNKSEEIRLEILRGDRFEEDKSSLLSRLSKGEKLFVISTYQTLGAGQNIQYSVSDNTKYVRTNDFNNKLEKDFDALYLDIPTHIISEIDSDESSLVKRIYQIKYLEENAEIASKTAIREIKASFHKFAMSPNYVKSEIPKDIFSKNMAITKTIMQAVGRICRTNLKNRTIYIFAAPDLKNILGNTDIRAKLLNPEFKALLSLCNTAHELIANNTEQRACLVSERANSHINSILRYGFSKERVDFWKKLRSLVLQYPTITIGQLETLSRTSPDSAILIKNFYVKLDRPKDQIWYTQKEDYSSVEISFNRVLEQAVSAERAKLDQLMKIPEIRAFFKQNTYAKHFEVGDYILTPVLFNNIYKGALGETIGKYFFEKHLNIQLEELTEVETFEFFDYKIKDSDIYIDFKHWHKSMNVDKEKMHDKIFWKLSTCGGKLAIIANVVEEDVFQVHLTQRERLAILEVPSLYTSNLKVNELSLEKLWRTIDEYKHQNQ